MADRHPHRAGTVLGLERGVAAAYGGDRAGLHRRHRLPPGNAAADGWVCTVFQSGSLARSLSARPCHSP